VTNDSALLTPVLRSTIGRQRLALLVVWAVGAAAIVCTLLVAVSVNSEQIACSAVYGVHCLPAGTTFAEATGDFWGYWLIGFAIVLGVAAVVVGFWLRSRRRFVVALIDTALLTVLAVVALVWSQSA
jgi:hypothetical protein